MVPGLETQAFRTFFEMATTAVNEAFAMLKKKIITTRSLAIASVLLVAVVAVAVKSIVRPAPAEAFETFLSEGDVKEEHLFDVLVLAGDDVVPLVLERIMEPDLPQRRYAIGFVQNGRYRQALPYLEAILADPNEKDYFRGDALVAITAIDNERGMQLCRTYDHLDGYLGDVARGLPTSKEDFMIPQRSYWDALFGRESELTAP